MRLHSSVRLPFTLLFDSWEQSGSGVRNTRWEREEESGFYGERLVGNLLLSPLPGLCEYSPICHMSVKQSWSADLLDSTAAGFMNGCLSLTGVCMCSRAVWGLGCRCCQCLIKASSCWRWWGAAPWLQTISECWGLTGQCVCVCVEWPFNIWVKCFKTCFSFSIPSWLINITSPAATRTSCLCRSHLRTCWSSTWPTRNWSCSRPKPRRSNTWSTTSSPSWRRSEGNCVYVCENVCVWFFQGLRMFFP